MIVQVLKLGAAALADPLAGINAQLAALQTAGYFGSDPVPTPVVVVSPITNEFAALHNAEARAGDPPVVSVMFANTNELAPYGMVAFRDGLVRILIRYDAVADAPEKLFRDSAHTMRATLAAVRAWARGADSTRILEGVEIQQFNDIVIAGPPDTSQEAAPVTLACYLTLTVQDVFSN